MVGGLVEHEVVDARRPGTRRARPGCARRARGERRARPTWSAPRPNLASSERDSLRRQAGGRRERVAAAGSPASASARRAWSSSPTTTPGPSQRRPAASGWRPSRAPSSVVLPAAVRPAIASRSPQPISRSTGPSGTSPARPPRPPAGPRPRRRGAPRRTSAAAASPPTACRRPSSRSTARSVARALAASFSVWARLWVADELVAVASASSWPARRPARPTPAGGWARSASGRRCWRVGGVVLLGVAAGGARSSR